MSDLLCREATLDDLPAIIALLADDKLGKAREDIESGVDDRYINAFQAIDANPDQMQTVAVLDGEVAGCMQLSFLPGLSFHGAWRGQIESVRIASELRGTGLGRQYVAWAIERFRERDCRLVQLNTHKSRTDAVRFYVSLGFEATHEGFKLAL
jgi:ribosomal protein S18 acetylase RimI-like enzyme